jgi:hypothetical protein
MLIAGGWLVRTAFHEVWGATASAGPRGLDPSALNPVKTLVTELLLGQIRTGLLFPILVGWALLVRKKEPGTHKRLMMLATLLPLQAATDRVVFALGLPTTTPGSPLSADLYSLLIIAPLFVHDILRYKRVHRAYLIWLAFYLPATVAMNWLWGSPWWLAFGPKLIGVEG